MTYQELLVEFDKRRITHSVDNLGTIAIALDDIEWAIQSILEKLRDGDKE